MANSIVFGIFSTQEQVETAVNEMKREDFGTPNFNSLPIQ